jgi:DNA-binding MarR family transcriptional regulator
MERDELVEKTHHATDRRVKEILLTTKGREIAPQVIKAARQFLDELISTILSEEEQKALIQMLRRITVLIP